MKPLFNRKSVLMNQTCFTCLMLMIFLLQAGITQAQQKKVTKKEVPAAVIKAVESDYMSCKDKITWQVYDESAGIDYYVATARGKNITCEAVYDKDGNLIRAKTVMKNTKLPEELLERIYNDYPDWEITGDQVVIRDFDRNNSYTEIAIASNGEKKMLYYDSSGEEITPELALNVPKTKVQENRIPINVTKAVESDYLSCKENIAWYLYNRGEGNPDHYVATATGKNIRCESVYDGNGKLISSKTITTNVKLPLTISQSIYKEYPGWTITEDQMVVRDFNESTKYYQVVIMKEGEKQTLYYNSKGQKMMKPENI